MHAPKKDIAFFVDNIIHGYMVVRVVVVVFLYSKTGVLMCVRFWLTFVDEAAVGRHICTGQ